MNFGRISCSALLLAMAGSGCISIPMDDTDQYRNEEKPNFRQVTAISVDRIEPEFAGIRYLPGMFNLKLYAVGKFVEHDGCQTERVNIGRRTLTIGLWPGAALDNENSPSALVVASLFANTLLCGIPTISSVLFEPFRDYSVNSPRYSISQPQKDVYLADVGLIGFRKHYSGGSKTRTPTGFRETERKNCSRVSLYGFSVEINGKQYKTESDGSVFLAGHKSGERIRVKIVGAPSVNNDSTDRMTELVGTEFDLVVP